MIKGALFIVSAPSGAGKTTLCKELIQSAVRLKQSVSFATRKPRRGEIQDIDYTFISEKEFKNMIDKGDFLEWAEVHGNLYGTSRSRIVALMNEGYDVLLDIDTQGAEQIRKSCDGGVFIFILPPSMEILKKRLVKRKSNTPEEIERRLRRALDEIKDYYKYDYVIVNDKLNSSLSKLEAIIISERLKYKNLNPDIIKNIIT
jgi:guanylate kinase